jgi:hypothetical protein
MFLTYMALQPRKSQIQQCDEQFFNDSQGDTSREKEIEQKYKEKKNQSEESRYTKKYERNIRSKCEGEYCSILQYS